MSKAGYHLQKSFFIVPARAVYNITTTEYIYVMAILELKLPCELTSLCNGPCQCTKPHPHFSTPILITPHAPSPFPTPYTPLPTQPSLHHLNPINLPTFLPQLYRSHPFPPHHQNRWSQPVVPQLQCRRRTSPT